ncbi:MAG: hypothetical protein ACI4R8_04135 [Candidatus Caccovivens sp.]
MNNLQGLISIARKAGYVIIGLDNLKSYSQKLYLLLVDKSAGKSLSREMNFLADKRNVPLLQMDNLSEIIDKCKAIGVKNKAFADSIGKILKGE